MKLLLTLFSFISLFSFSQNDTLMAFVFNEKYDYLERMKVAEKLFDRNPQDTKLGEILFDYFDLVGNKEKLCACHRNSKIIVSEDLVPEREIYGAFVCAFVQGSLSLAEVYFDNSKNHKKYSSIRNRMIYDLANYYQLIGEYKKALELTRQYSLDWNSSNWYEVRHQNHSILVLKINSEYKELSKVYDILLEKNPTKINYLIESAQINSYLKNYKKAIERYNTAIELEPKNSNSILELAKVHSKNNDTLLATENYQKAINTDSTNISNYYAFIEHLEIYGFKHKRDSLSSVVFSKPITDFKSEYTSEIDHWYSYISGDWKNKIAYTNKAIKIERDSIKLAKYYHTKGLIFQRKYKNKDAIKCYTKALTYDSTMVEAYLNRGNVYLRKFNEKSLENAKSDFEKVLSISQYAYYQSLANFGLGKYYYSIRYNRETYEKLNLSIQQNPENGWPYYYLAKIAVANQKFEKSIQLLEKAVELDPQERMFSFQLQIEKERINR